MQACRNDQRHVWLLSGTGEGPVLVAALVAQGWRVSVSVVSASAAGAYAGLSLEDLWTGPLDGVEGILGVLDQARDRHQGFDWVVDATHPFAVKISTDLQLACQEFAQPLLRFERPMEGCGEASLIASSADLARQTLQGSRLLMALGARHLGQAVRAARQAGAQVFARVLPSPESLRHALASGLPEHHLAVVRPLQGQSHGELESALCRRWSITAVVCRQSGGVTQQLWHKICRQQGLGLWLISRPQPCVAVEAIGSVESLLNRLSTNPVAPLC